MPRLPLPSGGAAKAFGTVTFLALGAIVYSHYSQVRDKNVMRAGVERDKERLRMKRKQQKEESVATSQQQ